MENSGNGEHQQSYQTAPNPQVQVTMKCATNIGLQGGISGVAGVKKLKSTLIMRVEKDGNQGPFIANIVSIPSEKWE
jgi:hypothetical protein